MNRQRALLPLIFWLVPILAMPGCATWTHESEVPEVMKAGIIGAGVTAGTSFDPLRRDRSEAGSSINFRDTALFPSLRLGLGKNFETTTDLGINPFYGYSNFLWAIDARMRYQWLDSETGYASTVAAGYFQGEETDHYEGDLSPAQNSDPANPVLRFLSKYKGVSLSNSVGKKISQVLMIYAGPKVYWVKFSGNYDRPITGGEAFNYQGPMAGVFLGTVFHIPYLNLDLKASLTRTPSNLRGGWQWAPGIGLTAQFVSFR
jgi:hypothetical protein